MDYLAHQLSRHYTSSDEKAQEIRTWLACVQGKSHGLPENAFAEPKFFARPALELAMCY